MSPRALIIAAQTAAVGALVVVVYAALLKPEEHPSPITRIETPNRAPTDTKVERPDGRELAGEESTRPPKQPAAGPARNAETAPAAGEGVVVAATPRQLQLRGQATAWTPRGDQYADAAEALLDRLAGGAPPGQ